VVLIKKNDVVVLQVNFIDNNVAQHCRCRRRFTDFTDFFGKFYNFKRWGREGAMPPQYVACVVGGVHVRYRNTKLLSFNMYHRYL